jgi:hypothetical protein
VLRPSDGSGFIATVNADVDMIKQNRFFLTQHNYFIDFLCGCFHQVSSITDGLYLRLNGGIQAQMMITTQILCGHVL